MPFRFMSSISPTIAFSKDAFPNQRRTFARRTKFSACQNQPNRLARRLSVTNCCVSLQAQYQAFVRFTVESSTAPAIALNSTCFWNLSPGGLSFRELWPHPHRLTGPVTLDRCCGRNVVAPGEYSKGFFCVPKGLYQAILWPATALGMPARSALGAVAGVNPAFVIKASIGPLWPCPASTTRDPPGARRPAAWGISAR